MKTDFNSDEMSRRDIYRMLTAVVVPRPIAWVATTSTSGVDNLAPHSFFTVASVDPPIIQFTSVGVKDSLTNIEATKEFVVNMAPTSLIDSVNLTGAACPPEISEFDIADLAKEQSLTVTAPRVAESPVSLECVLHEIIPMGNCHLVFGKVTHAVVETSMLEGNHPVISKMGPLSRLGLDEWGTSLNVQELKRIRVLD